ncbi:MAG: LemA family protein [Bacteroidetes bacterium]|uniref:LemA family protein n=1 Tax=Candidatus Cryptobacteroides excrementipullorum TaxID=2840761 RepID=A0A9D9NM84_9BACT|nr:LemA family protein [Candidatus Cryptobacteroides excrementipullorum]
MKKGLTVIVIIAAIVLALFFWVKNSYNGLVKSDEQVKAAWSQVENVYQRRADLIPNLVATVKGYAAHESSTLESVVEARSKATQVTVDPDRLDAGEIARFQEAQGELTQALGRLVMLRESYPDLKANQNFMELQAQLEGTENRISTERMKFNETARSYNTMVRSFPKNIIASMFGFETKGYFEAAEGTETAPKVEF